MTITVFEKPKDRDCNDIRATVFIADISFLIDKFWIIPTKSVLECQVSLLEERILMKFYRGRT